MAFKYLSDPASSLATFKVNREFDASRDNTDLLTSYSKLSKLCCDSECAFLRHDHHISIRRVHGYFLVRHAYFAWIVADTQTIFHCRAASSHHRADTFHKVTFKVVLRSPTSLFRCYSHIFILVEIRDPWWEICGNIFPGTMATCWHDSVKPRALIFMFGISKRSAGKLFSIETHWGFLWVVASLDESTFFCLSFAVIAKASHVLEWAPGIFGVDHLLFNLFKI